MDSPAVLGFAICLCLAALVLVFLVVLKPRYGAIPLERRRNSSQPQASTVSRFTQSAVTAVDGVIGESGGPYNRAVLYNAGVKMSPADFTVAVGIGSVFAGVFAWFLTHILIGFLVAAATPIATKLVLNILTDKRRGKFEAQLTDTIQMLIGGLRVGHSVMRSIEAASQEADAPTSEELARIVNETRIGKDARVAIEDAADRMDSEDFRWIAQAVQINREVGGDLAEVLEQVAATIRERSDIKGQIRSLSAEGKMSAYILMALPMGVALFLGVINPGYLNVFVEHVVGIILMVVSVIMFIVGGFWLSRIVKIKF
jgi:tight adherence protein B